MGDDTSLEQGIVAMATGKFWITALFLMVAGCAAVTTVQPNRSFASRPGGWIKVSNRDCQAYQALAGAGGVVATWSGLCDGQYISGPGELAWYTQKTPTGYYDIKYFIALLQGNFSQGKLEGPGKLITRQGVAYGRWKNGILVSQSDAPIEPAQTTADANQTKASQVDSKFSKLLDQIVSEDSKSWANNRYTSGSMQASAPSEQGGAFIVTGDYTFNNGSRGWVKAHFAAGKLSCIEYWDFVGECRQVGQGLKTNSNTGRLRPGQAVIHPYDFGRGMREQQERDDSLMEEHNNHLNQPLDRNDSEYERVNSPYATGNE